MSNPTEILADIIQSRQSVFPNSFTGEIISDNDVNAILTNAIYAPSHRKINPWRFRVVGGEALESFATYFQEAYKRNTAKFSETKFAAFGKKVLSSSHIIIISMLPDADKPLPEWENVAATACAVQNIYLTAHAMGYGGYWATPGSMMKDIGTFTEMAEAEQCLGFFFLGVPKDELPPKVDKGNVEDYVSWV